MKLIFYLLIFISCCLSAETSYQAIEINKKTYLEHEFKISIKTSETQKNCFFIQVSLPKIGTKNSVFKYVTLIFKENNKIILYNRISANLTENNYEVSFLIDKANLDKIELIAVYQIPQDSQKVQVKNSNDNQLSELSIVPGVINGGDPEEFNYEIKLNQFKPE